MTSQQFDRHSEFNDVKEPFAIQSVCDRIRQATDARLGLSSTSSIDVIRADMELCLAVRAAATAFVDHFGLLSSRAFLDKSLADHVIDCMSKAHDAVDESAHDRAGSYKASIGKKRELVEGLSLGHSFEQVLLTLG
jgi:hypothetical protein